MMTLLLILLSTPIEFGAAFLRDIAARLPDEMLLDAQGQRHLAQSLRLSAHRLDGRPE